MKEERSLAASQCNKPQGMGASRRGVALSAAACGALALVLLALEGGTAYEMLLDLGREKYSVLEAQLWRQRGLTLEQQVAELQRLVDDHARKPGAGAAGVSARDALNITRSRASSGPRASSWPGCAPTRRRPTLSWRRRGKSWRARRPRSPRPGGRPSGRRRSWRRRRRR